LMIEELKNYANGMNANAEVLSWLDTTGKKAIEKRGATILDMEHVLDYLVSPAAPNRLQKMAYVDALRKAEEWSKQNQKKGRDLTDSDDDIKGIFKFKDGSRIVKLKTKKALQREGFLMSHCVGGYTLSDSCQIYSYRDSKNMPHATFEVKKSGKEIVQIKGKGNGAIHPKYIKPILTFLKKIGMDIRPNDMKNLGYYHLPKEHLEYLNKTKAKDQITEIGGEYYAF
jgi:PcfJ-like protein